MPITEIQRDRRNKHIGASDMPKILGISPYGTGYDVWLEKTGRVEWFQLNEATRAGLAFEEGVLGEAEKELGKLIRNQYRSIPELHIGAHLDAIRVEAEEPVEAKTSGLYGPLVEDWGDAGTDQVPDSIIVQVHVQMMALKNKPALAHVAAFLGGRGFRLYAVPRNDDLCDVIAQKAVAFWKQVESDSPPDSTPSLEVIKRVRRTPGKTVSLDKMLVDDWLAAKAAASEAQKVLKTKQAALLAALQDAEAGDFGDPERILTYMETYRKGYTVKPSTYRAARIVKRRNET